MTHDPSRVYLNPDVRTFEPSHGSDFLEFHQKLPDYKPTPLVSAPMVAARVGVRHVWVKDESSRLGMPAYKILGASWATYRELEAHFGPFPPWAHVQELARQLIPHLPLTLVAATDGNHGRAIARTAAWLGLNAHILVPEGMVPARIDAIRMEGAQIDVIRGSYDDAVRAAARMGDAAHLVISDTAWEGYERVPGWVMEGYGTIYREIDAQLMGAGEAQPDLVAVQMGVGSLAASVVRHYRTSSHHARVVGVEPISAACVLRSLKAGTPTEVAGPHTSIMAGLNCGNTSPIAWPFLREGLSASVAVPDDLTEEAMRLLAMDGVVSGESGAAGVAGLLAVLTGARAKTYRAALGITLESTVLTISTEGATDPGAYARIIGTSTLER